MSNQEAYIVAGLRTAVGKAPRGVFRFTRPDDLAEIDRSQKENSRLHAAYSKDK